ncbi:geranylgeranyl pyrophosphate synthase, chloroplastic-like [Pistacia vera]|uniref:geranylgeranyl pyrophosphate synthase, chloroplastic-like n=1 Tax=Pistacia vera TaxID=55513 RepID=UPI00126389B5|nr:geranylgeranyl pyrophosphate synthase, chloroplastic-like [Pistacia vera]
MDEKLITKPHKDPLPKFELEEYMAKMAKQINKALDEAVPLQNPQTLHEAMRYTFLAGGNRVFSTLCIASCELVGGNQSLAMPMACAMEMITTSAVILDDLPCMDNDDLRRGKPANHKVFGEAASVLGSHGLFCLAIEHFANKTENISPDRKLRAIVEICSAFGSEGALAGQITDLNSEGKEVNLSELEFIHRNKSGKFGEASTVCGAILGGGNEDEIARLRNYGMCVGLAYQVMDDILDATGNKNNKDQEGGRDLLRDKATYPKLIGVDESMKYARELVAQAIKELEYFDSVRAAPLYQMANFIVSGKC